MKKQNWTGEKKKLHLLILAVCLIFVLLCSCSSGQNAPESSVKESSTDASALSSDDTSDTASMDNVDLSTIYSTQTFQYKGDIYFYDYHGIYRLDPETSESELIYDDFWCGRGIVVHNDYIYFMNYRRMARTDLNGENYIEFEKGSFDGYEELHLYGNILAVTVADVNEDRTQVTSRTLFYDIQNDDNVLKESQEQPDLLKIQNKKDELLYTVKDRLYDPTEAPGIYTQIVNCSDRYIYFCKGEDCGRLNTETNDVEYIDEHEYNFFRTQFNIINGWIYYWDYPGDGTVAMARIKEDLSTKEIISTPTRNLSYEELIEKL